MLVTVEELQNYMDMGKLSPRATLGVGMILEGLQSELEQILGRPVEVGTYTESYRLLSDADRTPFYANNNSEVSQPNRWTIGLRKSPVVSVVSIYVSRYGGASSSLTYETDYGVRKLGIDVWNPSVDDEFTITYTAGLNGVDYKVLKLLILRAAARESQNMYDDNKGIQELEAKSSTVAVTGFTEQEKLSVKRLRRQRF